MACPDPNNITAELLTDLLRTETEFAERLCVLALEQGYALTDLAWRIPSAPLDPTRQRELWATVNGQSCLIGTTLIRFDDPTRVAIECVPLALMG